MKEVLGVTEGFKQVPDVLIHMLEGQSDWVVVSIFEEELEAKSIQVSFKNSLIAEIYVRSTRWVCHQSLVVEMIEHGRVVYQVKGIETSDFPLFRPSADNLQNGGELSKVAVRLPISIPTSIVVVQLRISIGGCSIDRPSASSTLTGMSWNWSSCVSVCE